MPAWINALLLIIANPQLWADAEALFAANGVTQDQLDSIVASLKDAPDPSKA